jgi:hypothetical protein
MSSQHRSERKGEKREDEPCRCDGGRASPPPQGTSCTRSFASCRGKRYRRCAGGSRWRSHRGSRRKSSAGIEEGEERSIDRGGKWKAHLEDGNRLDATGVRDVRATAKIDHGTATVDGGSGAVGDLVVDEAKLVRVVL